MAGKPAELEQFRTESRPAFDLTLQDRFDRPSAQGIHRSQQDIEALGWKMKLVNMLTMPLIVTAFGLLAALWRKRRRHAIAMLRKGGAA